MADAILHPQRTEVVVRGDGNCFYRAIALWRDETSENKPSSVVMALDNVEQLYASAVKQSSTKVSSTKTNTTKQSPQTQQTKQTKGNLSSTDTAAKKSSSACSSIHSATQPSQATYFKQRSPTLTKANHKQPTPTNVTTEKQTFATFEATQPSQALKNFVEQSFPAPTNGATPKTNSAMESSQDPAPKPKDPFPATKTTTTQPSSTSTSSKQPHVTPNFDNMDIKAIKEFISARGVQVSNYRKPQLIELAKAIASMDLPIDPDFKHCSIDECLIRRLTLPAGLKIPDPFQMSSLSHDFSQLPPFGWMDIFSHLIMSKTDYDKAMLSSWRSFEKYNLFKWPCSKPWCKDCVRS